MQSNRFQVAIIGGGVVGTAIARELSRFRVSVLLIEKEVEVGWGVTKANSGIVHAGFHSKPGTLKARLCVEGNRLMEPLCLELGVPFRRNGLLMVARSSREVTVLRHYLAQGKANGVPGLRVIPGEQARELEPQLSTDIVAALSAPTAGVISPFELAIAQEENARQNGVEVLTGTRLTGIRPQGRQKVLVTTSGTYTADYVINAAGLQADAVARMIGDDSYLIRPRKGEEYLLDKRAGNLVSRTIFPTPTQNSKGILVIPTVEGNIMIGPTAEETDDELDVTTTSAGFTRILSSAQTLVPAISPGDVITSFAGLRPASDRSDFIIEESPVSPGFVHVAGIESPGLTAAPAIAHYVRQLLGETGLPLTPRQDYNPIRRPIPRFSRLTRAEKQKLIAQDSRYGRVICRCETVTEGEIVEAIRRGARTVDGIKFRTRAGMGRCQGGFCQPHVLRILARALGVPETSITKRGGSSHILLARTKELHQTENPEGGMDNVAPTQ